MKGLGVFLQFFSPSLCPAVLSLFTFSLDAIFFDRVTSHHQDLQRWSHVLVYNWMHNQSSIDSKVLEVMKIFILSWTQSQALVGSLKQQ